MEDAARGAAVTANREEEEERSLRDAQARRLDSVRQRQRKEDGLPTKDEFNSDVIYRVIGRMLKWPALGPTFILRYLLAKWLPSGFGVDLSKYWICRTRFFQLILGLTMMALCAAFTIGFYFVAGTYLVGPTMSAINFRGDDLVGVFVIGSIVHFILRIWSSNRHTAWVGAPAYGLWLYCTLGVMDGLRGYVTRGEMMSFSMVAAAALGLWLLLRPVYLKFGDIDGIDAAKEKLDLELNAAYDAMEQDKAQGKAGEARVHAALQKALSRHFGSDWALVPQGGLLPIEGRIPFTDIDHIAVTAQGIIAFETKDWAWDKISPVRGDNSVVERRREGQIERFKNPYQQAQMKPQHLRNSLGLGADVPVMFAVVFANSRNRLGWGMPENMLTLSALPKWLKGIAKNGAAQINVVDMDKRIRDRLDYSDEAYKQFRLATDTGDSYASILNRWESAATAWKADQDSPMSSVTGSNRPGVVPRTLFYASLGVMVVAILLSDTGTIGARAADAMVGPAQVPGAWALARSTPNLYGRAG